MLALVLLLLPLALAAGAGAAPGAYVTAADAVPVDANADGLFDSVSVNVTLQPPVSGSYSLQVTLAWPTPATPTPIVSTTEVFALDTQPRRITVSLEGPRIREAGLDGPFELQVTLLSSPSGPVNDTATFPTAAWRAQDFAPGPDTGKPRIVWGTSEVDVYSRDLAVTVNLTSPAVQWQTGPDAPRPGRFEVAFPAVVSFNDTGDGALSSGESPLCTAPVGGAPWAVESLDIGSSAEWGSYIALTLRGRAQFGGAGCPGGPGANVSLSFLLAQRNGTVTGPAPYTLAGGLELSIGLGLTFDSPVPGNAVAFEAQVRDLDVNTSFLMRGATGFEKVDLRNQTLDQEPFAPAAPASPEPVSLTDDLGAVRGNFSWVPVATERSAQGVARFVEVSASRGSNGTALRLYLAVPNDPDVVAVTLGAALGVPSPEGLPHGGGEPVTPPTGERPSLTIFVAALAAVSAIFLLSVYARAKKY